MHRAFRIGLVLLPWLGVLFLSYLLLERNLSVWWDTSSAAHSAARSSYYAELAFEGCVSQDAVIATAEARNWPVRIMDEPLHWCHAPTGLTDWVHVEISPPLPFSTEDENAAFIAFDENGCMARWEYGSGEGSTCPDH
ncbi:hypothetical protein [Gymnodinialimonas hymeniacidonis]|uniref:hypothetical protein n=1 Tax=Gymnodinialimonas hymeniacidonis TaxID=3126508 RepID=UPI0034C5CFA9